MTTTTLLSRAALAAIASLLTVGPLLAAAAGTNRATAALPNIVIILADDLGYGSVGCYGADPKLVRTPHIDRLAREGRRFTDANTTSSVCSPTRYALLTGRYCWRTSLKYGVLNTSAPLHIEPGRPTLASVLKRRGYATAAIGKWHLGYGDESRVDFTHELKPGPLEISFDYHWGIPSNHADGTGVYIEDRRIAGLRSDQRSPAGKNFRGSPYMGFDAPQRVDENVMPDLTDKAIGWIERHDRKQPFFLYFTPVAPHEPVTPSPQVRGTSAAGIYGDWLHELDLQVGRLLATLDRLQLVENTLVIFTSDNGGNGEMAELTSRNAPNSQVLAMRAGLDLNKPWRGRKHSIYQGGFRVPFVVRWPGHVPAGSVTDETVSVVDLLATFSVLIGERSLRAGEPIGDSYNVLPAFLGPRSASPLRPFLILHSAEGVFAIRQGPWRWIEGRPAQPNPSAKPENRREPKPQLYHLVDDPAESRDVLAEHPEVGARLAALLETIRADESTPEKRVRTKLPSGTLLLPLVSRESGN